MQNVFRRSVPPPEGTLDVQGYDFDKGRDLDKLMASMMQSGFQATQLGRAVELVNEMVCSNPRHARKGPVYRSQ
jgi:deoxyhypusine synthase